MLFDPFELSKLNAKSELYDEYVRKLNVEFIGQRIFYHRAHSFQFSDFHRCSMKTF